MQETSTVKIGKAAVLAAGLAVTGAAWAQVGAAEQMNAMMYRGIESLEWGLLLEAEGASHSHATISLEYLRMKPAGDNRNDTDRITAQLACEI